MSFCKFLEFSESMAFNSRPVADGVKSGQEKKEPNRRSDSEKREDMDASIS